MTDKDSKAAECASLADLAPHIHRWARVEFYRRGGLTEEEATKYVLAEEGGQPIPEATAAKVDAIRRTRNPGHVTGDGAENRREGEGVRPSRSAPDPVMVTSVTADEVMRAIAAPFLGRPNPETIECVGDKLTMTGTLSIRYTLTQEDGRWSMEDRDDLGLSGSADDNATPAQHVRAFLEEFLFVWDHYAIAPDAKLTSDAQELKRRLLGLFGLEAAKDKEVYRP